MTNRASNLQSIRKYIQTTGGAYLKNVRRTDARSCPICAGIKETRFELCFSCYERRNIADLADELGFITYAQPSTQSGQLMRAYKSEGDTAYQLVSALLTYGIVYHWDCIPVRLLTTSPDAWATVPSLSGRTGEHPLRNIARGPLRSLPEIVLRPRIPSADARSFSTQHFECPPTTVRHVLLIEDTWVSGNHLQSAAATLKAAGVEYVTGLVVARWVDPGWAGGSDFLKTLPTPIEPRRCPFTGKLCH